jgi:hypothetical protein
MTVAVLGVVLLGGLAVLQTALIAGAPLGRFAWGGQHAVLPSGLRIGSAVAIALYVVVAAFMLQVGGALDVLPERLTDVALWVLTGYFTLGVLLNAVSRSRSERAVMTPVSAVLAASCLVLALH